MDQPTQEEGIHEGGTAWSPDGTMDAVANPATEEKGVAEGQPAENLLARCYHCGAELQAPDARRCLYCGHRQYRMCYCGHEIRRTLTTCPHCQQDWSRQRTVRRERRRSKRSRRSKRIVQFYFCILMGGILGAVMVSVLFAPPQPVAPVVVPIELGEEMPYYEGEDALTRFQRNLVEAVDGITSTVSRFLDASWRLLRRHALFLAGILAGCVAGAVYYVRRRGHLPWASHHRHSSRRRSHPR